MESLQHAVLASREIRVRALGDRLSQVEAELKTRSVADLTTAGLLSLASRLRREILAETGPLQFSAPLAEIPTDEEIGKEKVKRPGQFRCVGRSPGGKMNSRARAGVCFNLTIKIRT